MRRGTVRMFERKGPPAICSHPTLLFGPWGPPRGAQRLCVQTPKVQETIDTIYIYIYDYFKVTTK